MLTRESGRGSAATAAPPGRTYSQQRTAAQRAIGWLYTGLAWAILAGLLLQVYLAGTALFGATTFEGHRSLGMALVLPVLLLPVLALAGRMGWRLIGLSALLLFLTIVQIVLPGLRDDISFVAALHPVNGMALGGVTSICARRGRTWATAPGRVVGG